MKTKGGGRKVGTGQITNSVSARLRAGGAAETVGKARPGILAKPRGMGLRAKFMLVLTVVTTLALVALGLSMANTTNRYLFGQKQHDGIELAKMAAQIAHVLSDDLGKYTRYLEIREKLNADERAKLRNDFARDVKQRVEEYLGMANSWGDTTRYSDILAVRFDTGAKFPELSSAGIGPEEIAGSGIEQRYTSIFVPKEGATIDLPKGVEFLAARKRVGGGEIPIYRFKIALDPERFGANSTVRVDIDASSVAKVGQNLYTAIILGVIVAAGVVIAVANWLAGNITRPVDVLLKDMQIVARGDLAHHTKAHSSDEIGVLAHEFNRMTVNLAAAQSALIEQEKAEYELSIAREVQRQLLPSVTPTIDGYEVGAFYQGAKAVSGDYFDFIPLGERMWGFIVADVSGKGIPGSMVMAVTRTIVRLVANRHLNHAAETLKETNRLISKQIKRGMFVTSFYAILDERTGTLTYVSAGHNPMVIYRAATRTHELASAKGIALGFNEGPIFDRTIEEHRTVLAPGDAFVLYTDGFPEAMNAENQEFGDERFYQLIGRNGHVDSRTLINGLVGEIAKHRGEAEQSDDLTLITVRRTGA